HLHCATGRHRCPALDARPDRGTRRRRSRLSALDRKALPGAVLLRRQRLARRLRALQGDSAIWRDGAHNVDSFEERRRDPAIRPEEARIPDCREHPTTLGSIGMTTGLDPSMTLGCGGYGGNITSDNISPQHLLNIKRLAYETSPAP